MIARHLELATYLTNEWSLSSEICEDMEIEATRLKKLVHQVKKKGIDIDREDGKIRLAFNTTIDNVRFAVE